MDNMTNMARMRELRDTVNDIEQRAGDKITYDKIHEYQDGIESLKQEYGDIYKTEVLNEMIEEYKQEKTQSNKEALSAFDERSHALVTKANNYIKRLEADLKSSVDPTTQFEMDKHNYVLNKLQNELETTFTSGQADISELDEVINQVQYNKLYANAFLQVQSTLEQNIQNNSNINKQLKSSLLFSVREKMNDVKNNVLPSEYHELQKLKERLEVNYLSSEGKTNMYELLINIDDNIADNKKRKLLYK